MADTMLRHWTMLQLIPRAPRKISVQDLASRLNAQGYEVTERTIQRDLQKLSGSPFPLRADERNRPFGWCWSENSTVMDIPGMDPQAALDFTLAERFLHPLMAPTTPEALRPHFECGSGWRGRCSGQRRAMRTERRSPATASVAKVDHSGIMVSQSTRGEPACAA